MLFNLTHGTPMLDMLPLNIMIKNRLPCTWDKPLSAQSLAAGAKGYRYLLF